MYRIDIDNRAEKQIISLPSHIIQSVFEAIEGLKINPRPLSVKKMMGVMDGVFASMIIGYFIRLMIN